MSVTDTGSSTVAFFLSTYVEATQGLAVTVEGVVVEFDELLYAAG